MSRGSDRVRVTVDNRALEVPAGVTILQAARSHDIYIPTLCYHPELSAYGGCRLCIVEVEGMSRFPTACTTPVEDGMVIRTQTAQVQQVRAEVLQLILSEHPGSCLVCDERDECRRFVPTIRKAGVTTGCRYCPSDDSCELQRLAERLGVTDLRHPVSYRHLPVERDDPFYDRDYNLCILCGRCVRVCQEVRAAGTLAFLQRGSQTVVGPAFGRTHVEAGCELCGACVEVCPTGALAEKTRKWDGQAESAQVTTCALCGIGCQLKVEVKGGRVLGALPVEGLEPNRGQLCVKGRFCIPELVNHHLRLRQPRLLRAGTAVTVSWEEAAAVAAERLRACPPDRFRLLASADCSNEALYLAQKLARSGLGSNHVDTSARAFYGPALDPYLRLLAQAVPSAELRRATAILAVGLDSRYARSVVGVELRRAVDRGAKLLSLHPRPHNLTLIADRWLEPAPGEAGAMVAAISAALEKPRPRGDRAREGIAAAARTLGRAARPLLLVGPDLLRDADAVRLLDELALLASRTGAGVVCLPAFSNLAGAVLMGAFAELAPGGRASSAAAPAGDQVAVLYLLGEVPPPTRPPGAFVIAQNVYPPEPCTAADLALPAAAFTEEDGSVVSGELKVMRRHRAVDPPGEALPDWAILCLLARAVGVPGFDFRSAAEVHREIAAAVEGFADLANPPSGPIPFRCEARLARPAVEPDATEHSYRGHPLSSRVEGARVLLEPAGASPTPART